MPLFVMCFISFLRANKKCYPAMENALIVNFWIISATLVISVLTNTAAPTYINSGVGLLGWFSTSNAQSAVVSMLAPIVIAFCYRKKNFWLFCLTTAAAFAQLYFLGTRLAFMSIFAVALGMPVVLLLTRQAKTSRRYIAVLIVTLAICCAFVKQSPMYINQNQYQAAMSSKQKDANVMIQRTTGDNEDLSTVDPAERYHALCTIYNFYSPKLCQRFGTAKVMSAYDYSSQVTDITATRHRKIVFCSMLMDEHPFVSRIFGMELSRMSFDGDIYDVENDFHGIYFLYGWAGLALMVAFVAYFLLRAPFGDASGLAKVASMMTGSYIGGGVNFAAMASQYAAGEDLTAAATVADNLLMAVYFFVLIAFASFKFFRKHYKHPHIDEVESGTKTADESVTQAAAFWSRKDISLKDIAVNIAYAVAIVWLAQIVSGFFAGIVPENPGPFMDFVGKFFGSQYVWITTFSVIVATCFHKQVEKMHGSQEIGTYLIYLFLFVIGVPANIMTVVTKSPLLLVLTAIMVCVNMLFCFFGAKLFKCDLEDAIIASNANIGGPTTAAGMAISQGWTKLVGPAMLVGVLGYVVGNYMGTIVGIVLGA